MGYRPNALVAAHMSHVRGTHGSPYQATIALLLFADSDPNRASLNELHRKGAQDRALQLGYRLDCIEVEDRARGGAALARILKSRGIHGVLVGSLDVPEAEFDFPWSDFAAVALGLSLARPKLHRASYDNYHGMGILLQTLLDRGYERPALAIDASSDARSHHYTLAYFLAWQRIHDLNRPVPPLLARQWTEVDFRTW